MSEDGLGFRLESRGRLGASFATFLVLEDGPDGPRARVGFVIKHGWLGPATPAGCRIRQLAALRELGFDTVSYRDGRAHPLL